MHIQAVRQKRFTYLPGSRAGEILQYREEKTGGFEKWFDNKV